MDWVILAATVAIALAVVVSAWSTWHLSRDNRALLKAGTEPEVVAYLELERPSGYLVNLVLENVGQGPARDVKYFVEADPKDFAAHGVEMVPVGTLRKIASLLPQGGRRERLMGLGSRLYEDEEKGRLEPFRVKISYSNLRGMLVEPKEFALDISELGGETYGTHPTERLAKSVEKIARSVGHVTNRGNRLRVETITTAERRAEEKERRARPEKEAATDGGDEAKAK